MSPSDDPIPAAPLSFNVDGEGRYVVTFGNRELPRVFDRGGHLLSIVGKKGQGPAEFDTPVSTLVLPGDSLLVLDPGNARASVLGPDLRVSRVISGLPSVTQPRLVHWPDAVLAFGLLFTPDQAGFPLHVLSFGGTSVRIESSFGGEGGNLYPGDSERLMRILGPVEQGNEILVAHMLTYDIELADLNGQSALLIRRRPDWFRAVSPWSFGYYDYPPPPMVDAITRDAERRIWVFLRRHVENWKAAWPPGLPRSEFPTRLLPPIDHFWRTEIEVFDPDGRTLLARAELSGVTIDARRGPQILVFRSTPAGEPAPSMLRLELVDGNTGQPTDWH